MQIVAEPLESTATLVRRVQGGEERAREELVSRCLPALKKWAHGRLPFYGRDLAETDDLVQITFMRALRNVHSFQPERQGAFLAYLRKILINAARDEVRRGHRTPTKVSLDGSAAWLQIPGGDDPETSLETIEAYESALSHLPERVGQSIVLRIEFGMTFPEIAAELDYPSANAARMQVSRGLVKLAENMPE